MDFFNCIFSASSLTYTALAPEEEYSKAFSQRGRSFGRSGLRGARVEGGA